MLDTLSRGSEGALVRHLQSVLNVKFMHKMGMRALSIDGIFGPLTEAAVKFFQVSKGLRMDGIVGRRTWSALCSSAQTSPGMLGIAAGLLHGNGLSMNGSKNSEGLMSLLSNPMASMKSILTTANPIAHAARMHSYGLIGGAISGASGHARALNAYLK